MPMTDSVALKMCGGLLSIPSVTELIVLKIEVEKAVINDFVISIREVGTLISPLKEVFP